MSTYHVEACIISGEDLSLSGAGMPIGLASCLPVVIWIVLKWRAALEDCVAPWCSGLIVISHQTFTQRLFSASPILDESSLPVVGMIPTYVSSAACTQTIMLL